MPSFVTHHIEGLFLFDTLTLKQQEIVSKYKSCFEAGLQGHDSLFYIFGKFKGYGAFAHKEKLDETIKAIASYVKQENNNESLISFSYGLISHLVLDSIIHPYVHYKSAIIKPSLPDKLKKSAHYLLEGSIDFLLWKKYFADINSFDSTIFLYDDSIACKVFADIYYNAVNPLYSKNIPYSKLLKALKRFKTFQKVFDNENGLKFKLLLKLSSLAGNPQYILGFIRIKDETEIKDPLNKRKLPFPIATNLKETSTLNIEEMLIHATKETMRILNYFDSYIYDRIEISEKLFHINSAGESII